MFSVFHCDSSMLRLCFDYFENGAKEETLAKWIDDNVQALLRKELGTLSWRRNTKSRTSWYSERYNGTNQRTDCSSQWVSSTPLPLMSSVDLDKKKKKKKGTVETQNTLIFLNPVKINSWK